MRRANRTNAELSTKTKAELFHELDRAATATQRWVLASVLVALASLVRNTFVMGEKAGWW